MFTQITGLAGLRSLALGLRHGWRILLGICPVIFVTAYPERLLTGERVEPTYLIAKPYVDKVVQTTIAFALFNHGWADRPEVA